METPTPRTSAAAYFLEGRTVVNAHVSHQLEAELTAANARIAEMEKEKIAEYDRGRAHEACEQENLVDSLTRQLSESQAQLASVKKERDKAVAFSSRIERGEHHFESLCKDQLQGIAEAFKDEKGIHEELFDAVLRCKLRRDELEAQLASAREDVARLDWLDSPEGSIQQVMRLIRKNGEEGNPPLTYRSAIDSTRNITSPPTPAETAPESTEENL